VSDAEPLPATRRTGRIVAGGAVLAAVLAMAVGSAASRAPSPAEVWSSSVIPWSQVGDGWTLLQVSDLPSTNSLRVTNPDQLLLIAPHGVKYRTVRLEGSGMWRLTDWDHRSQRALLVRPGAWFSGGQSTDVLQVDLRTGVEHQFTAQVEFTAVRESSPGTAIRTGSRSSSAATSWPSTPHRPAGMGSSPARRCCQREHPGWPVDPHQRPERLRLGHRQPDRQPICNRLPVALRGC
jgi:hypothetical protein